MRSDELEPVLPDCLPCLLCPRKLRLHEADVGLESGETEFLHLLDRGEEQVEVCGIEIPGIGLATGPRPFVLGSGWRRGRGREQGGALLNEVAAGQGHGRVAFTISSIGAPRDWG